MEAVKTLIYILLACLITALAGTAHAEVWHSTHRWTDQCPLELLNKVSDSTWDSSQSQNKFPTYEDCYSLWVKRTVSIHEFDTAHGLYNKHLDCAQTNYTLRAEFSFENGLPFVALGGRISNSSTALDSKYGVGSSPAKFQAFIDSSKGSFTTNNLSVDTCSVQALDRKYIRAGTIILDIPGPDAGSLAEHHSLIIKDIDDDGELTLYSGSYETNPTKASRTLNKTATFYFHPHSQADGLRNWKHPGEGCPQTQPGELSQYDPSLPKDDVAFVEGPLKKHLRLMARGLNDKIRSKALEACEFLRQRAEKVQDGLNFQQTPGYVPFTQKSNPGYWDKYSTPNKDIFLRNKFEALEGALCKAKSQQSNDEFLQVIRGQDGRLHIMCKSGAVEEPTRYDNIDDNVADDPRLSDAEKTYREARSAKLDVFDRGCLINSGNVIVKNDLFEKRLLSDENLLDGDACHPVSSDPNDSVLDRWGMSKRCTDNSPTVATSRGSAQ